MRLRWWRLSLERSHDQIINALLVYLENEFHSFFLNDINTSWKLIFYLCLGNAEWGFKIMSGKVDCFGNLVVKGAVMKSNNNHHFLEPTVGLDLGDFRNLG